MESEGMEGLGVTWMDDKMIGGEGKPESRTSWMDWAECDRVAKGLKVWRPTKPGSGSDGHMTYRSLMDGIDAYIRSGSLQREHLPDRGFDRRDDRGLRHRLYDAGRPED